MTLTLSELQFGDLEAYDEASNHPDYFELTFVTPDSMSVKALKNSNKFIVVGRKGSGKTAIQMHMANNLRKEGYLTRLFSFHNDMSASDYATIAQTQTHISVVDVINDRNIFLQYDYRQVWLRSILTNVAEELASNGFETDFVRFMIGKKSILKNIFEGISKAVTVSFSAEMKGIAAQIDIDLSQYLDAENIPLDKFNVVAKELFKNHCKDRQMYFFVDELVFSKLDASEDELKARAAMVRDIIKVSRELNNFSHQNKIDFHFVCSIRPEIRNLINDMDAEVGKILDGKDVNLNWLSSAKSDTTLLSEILRKKITHSAPDELIDFDNFVTKTISFNKNILTLDEFIKTNTWGRPRDIVRLLISIAKTNPTATKISEDAIKNALNEYSRTSTKELTDELSVRYGGEIQKALKDGIQRKYYDSKEHFWDNLSKHLYGHNMDVVLNEFFELGVIGNFDEKNKNYYWFHRGSTSLKPQFKIIVHPGLWNELAIRGRDS